MRGLRKLAVATAIVSSIVVMMPGAVAAPVGGEVTGFVTYDQTELPLEGCANQKYNFSGVILNGTVSHGANVFAGSISTSNVYGASSDPDGAGPKLGCETLSEGYGTVASSSNPASFTGSGLGTASGNFYGTYSRINSVVTVNLTLSNAKVNGVSIPNTTILVTAQFTPYSFNTTTGGIKAAAFAGTFQGV